jgi:hypothetical protein
MTLSASKLKTELESLGPTASEATARARLAAAWTTYFYDASVAGAPCAGGTLDSAQGAMEAAMTGMSAAGAGPAKIQAGVVAFWSDVAPRGATVWSGTVPPFTPPTTLTGLSAALLAAFSANQGASKSLSEAAEAVADVLHNNGGLGGLATVPGPPPVATPIL